MLPRQGTTAKWQQWHCFTWKRGERSSHTGLLVKALVWYKKPVFKFFFCIASNPQHLPSCDSIFCQRKFNTRSIHLKNEEQKNAWSCILLIWTLISCGYCILILAQRIFSLFFFFLGFLIRQYLIYDLLLCCTYHVLTSAGVSFPIIGSPLQETEYRCMLLCVLLSFGIYFVFGFCFLVWWELRELM